jgi:3-hydroxybutyrate dehydrogenase
VIVTASGSSLAAERFKAAYVAAKHAVVGLVKVAALEGAESGLTANAVAPGWMDTPLVAAQLDDQSRLGGISAEAFRRQIEASSPSGRLVSPAEVAQVVAFLASPAAAGVNGALLPVDHGESAG